MIRPIQFSFYVGNYRFSKSVCEVRLYGGRTSHWDFMGIYKDVIHSLSYFPAFEDLPAPSELCTVVVIYDALSLLN